MNNGWYVVVKVRQSIGHITQNGDFTCDFHSMVGRVQEVGMEIAHQPFHQKHWQGMVH